MTEENNKKAHHNSPQPVRNNEGVAIIGPSSPSREAQSRDRLALLSTDTGTLPGKQPTG
jgi:hypothetical protein